MMRGGRPGGQDAPRGREVFWDASPNLQSSPTGEGVPIHVRHLVASEDGWRAGTTASGMLVRGQDELNCGGLTSGSLDWRCSSRVHRDADDCSRAIVLGPDLLRRVYRLAVNGGGGLGAKRLPSAGRGFGVGVMAPPPSSNSPRLRARE